MSSRKRKVSRQVLLLPESTMANNTHKDDELASFFHLCEKKYQFLFLV